MQKLLYDNTGATSEIEQEMLRNDIKDFSTGYHFFGAMCGMRTTILIARDVIPPDKCDPVELQHKTLLHFGMAIAADRKNPHIWYFLCAYLETIDAPKSEILEYYIHLKSIVDKHLSTDSGIKAYGKKRLHAISEIVKFAIEKYSGE